jgi:predicted Rossmann fold flavoprotein
MEILIVGAGAAGMMAAATIAERGGKTEVCLVEKNAVLGRKVIISGGGRCNVTTADNDMASLKRAYPRGWKFLRYAMHEFTPQEVYDWFEKRGIPLKYEGPKVFPVSNNGKDVTEMFERIFEQKGVEVLLKTSVDAVEKSGDGFEVVLNGEPRYCDKLILTTGGHAYRHTGSSGDGYSFAQALGHSITPLAATLTSFSVWEDWVGKLAGVSIPEAKFKLVGKEKHEFTGAFLFTHKGVTGPGIFALSSLSAFENCDKDNHLKLFIDFVPGQDYQSLNEEILRRIEESPLKNLLHNLRGFVPKSVLSLLLARLGVDEGRKSSEITKKDLNRCIEALKNFELTLCERTPGAEIVTAGGVALSEVDTKTMESKICPGLSFGGELLDIDGFTGGYNLQVAWATGRLAGLSTLS